MTKTEQKKNGVFYSPDFVVDYMIAKTLGRWKNELTTRLSTNYIVESEAYWLAFVAECREVRILDPSCGEGIFLLKTYQYLKEIYQKIPAQYLDFQIEKQIISNLYGIDIDQKAIDRLQEMMYVQTGFYAPHIRLGNALIADPALSEYAFDWQKEFPFEFDMIIGNPPYVKVTKNNLIKVLYQWNTDLYLMFYEKCLKFLLKPKGFLSFITPRYWLINRENENMRAFMLQHIDLQWLCETSPFSDANTECVITLIQNSPSQSDTLDVWEEKKQQFEKINLLKKSYSLARKGKEILTHLTEKDIKILQKIESDTVLLGQITESRRGMEIGKTELRHSKGFPTLIGQDVKAYQIAFENTFVSEQEKEYRRLKVFFEADSLIYLRRVAPRLMAAMSEKKYAFSKNIYALRLVDAAFDPYYLLALLNSRVLDYYYKTKFSFKKLLLFPEIQSYSFEALPIKKTSITAQKKIGEKAEKLLFYYTQKDRFELEIQAAETELDLAVYQLYGFGEVELSDTWGIG
jgi:TaqI-like C-terminal specificity domain/Eco57I restriction-modification methylase